MNILNAMFLKWEAGTENSFLKYAKTLNECNFNVINLICPNAQIIPKLSDNKLFYIESKLLGKFGKKDIFTIMYFKYLIKKYNIDMVLAHQGRLTSLFKKACGKKTKLVSINHGYNPKHCVNTDFVITLNRSTYNKTIKLGQNKNKISILPHSVEVDKKFIPPTPKTKNQIISIGSYGRFSSEKGYNTLIESLNILNKKEVPFKAYIGGTGIEEDHLKRKSSAYSLDNKINFVGWVNNKEKFYKKIDLFILPSHKEEFSITILESMKYSTSVIATKCNGPQDIIQNNKNGFLVNIDNPDEIADKIEKINKTPEILSVIARNAYDNLNEKYTDQKFKQSLNKIITQL